MLREWVCVDIQITAFGGKAWNWHSVHCHAWLAIENPLHLVPRVARAPTRPVRTIRLRPTFVHEALAEIFDACWTYSKMDYF